MNVEAYETVRSRLIEEERSLRRDAGWLSRATPEELRADDIIRELRAKEAVSVWGVEHPDIPNLYPGMEFLTARSLITKTKVFQLLQKMPKGALLHCHLDATVNATFLLKLALEEPAIHVRTPSRLTVGSIEKILPDCLPLAPEQATTSSSLCDESYTPGSWVPIKSARENFSTELGGPKGFDQWVTSSLTINPTEAYKTHNTVKKIWEKFTSTFEVSKGIIRYEPIWCKYIREFLLSSIEDNISYLEVRINFYHEFMYAINGDKLPHRVWILLFDKVVKEVAAELNSRGKGDGFIGAKIIYTTLKFITSNELEWFLEDCIALKQEFPHLITGFDLVGSENDLTPLIDYIEPLLRFKRRTQELGLDIPFILHAGETLGDGDSVDSNLYDAILLGTKRIGHGFSLAKHPKLIDICKERGIAVEVCPISNEILRLTSSMPMHPLPVLINNGIPVALCSDDPAVFGNMGLSFDFYQVFVSSEITGLLTLKCLARDSIEYSMLESSEKSRCLEAWEKSWNTFIKGIVSNSSLETTN